MNYYLVFFPHSQLCDILESLEAAGHRHECWVIEIGTDRATVQRQKAAHITLTTGMSTAGRMQYFQKIAKIDQTSGLPRFMVIHKDGMQSYVEAETFADIMLKYPETFLAAIELTPAFISAVVSKQPLNREYA